MKAQFSSFILCMLALTVLVLFRGETRVIASTNLNQQILKSIRDVKASKDFSSGTDAAEKLALLVHRHDPRSIPGETIHSIALLLDTRNDGIRFWVANALGDFGTRAHFAVPQLLHALSEIECQRVDVSSEGAIRECIRKAGATPPKPSKCDYTIRKTSK